MGLRWVYLFVHRFLRLSPVYFFLVFFFWGVFPSLSDSQLWYKMDALVGDCGTVWPLILTFVYNLTPLGTGGFCMGLTWHVSADM